MPTSPEPAPAVGRRITIATVAVLACFVPAACDYASASPAQRPTSTKGPTGTTAPGHQHGGTATAPAATEPTDEPTDEPADEPADDPTDPTAGPTAARTGDPAADPTATTAPTTSAAPAPPAGGANGLDVLGRDCSTSKLQPHTGFQIAPACVSTEFGEVSAPDKNPSLLITKAPRTVRADAPFSISVSTRNLVRDRFLGAAAGGYYLESSFLDPNGLQRGHFHTACRILPSGDVAPDAAPVPAFFVATQDNGGGSTPDTVVVNVTGLPKGEAQCTVWAGDGSHRVPMMQRANQTPAIDSVRITVQ